jgi:hypothetical protein
MPFGLALATFPDPLFFGLHLSSNRYKSPSDFCTDAMHTEASVYAV